LFCRRRMTGIEPDAIASWNQKELKAGIEIGVW